MIIKSTPPALPEGLHWYWLEWLKLDEKGCRHCGAQGLIVCAEEPRHGPEHKHQLLLLCMDEAEAAAETGWQPHLFAGTVPDDEKVSSETEPSYHWGHHSDLNPDPGEFVEQDPDHKWSVWQDKQGLHVTVFDDHYYLYAHEIMPVGVSALGAKARALLLRVKVQEEDSSFPWQKAKAAEPQEAEQASQ